MQPGTKKEKDLYLPMCKWLEKFLKDRYSNSLIEVYDTSLKSLSNFIAVNNYGTMFPPEWQSWDIHVDITGLIITNGKAELAFIEAKIGELSLRELSQLLGYCRVAHPLHAFLLSPDGCAGSLTSLLVSYSRRDVLEYYIEKGKRTRTIEVAAWDRLANNINQATIIK